MRTGTDINAKCKTVIPENHTIKKPPFGGFFLLELKSDTDDCIDIDIVFR